MTNANIELAYKFIGKTICNPKSICNSIADEIYNKYRIDRDDLIQEVVLKFIENEHKEIISISRYTHTFTYRALLNKKRDLARLKRIDKYREMSLDSLMDDGYEFHKGKIIREE